MSLPIACTLSEPGPGARELLATWVAPRASAS
jgi:hypothetical protein